MSIAYTPESWAAKLAEAQAAQTANTSWDAVNIIKNSQPELSNYDIINRFPDFIESDTASYGYAYKTVTFNKAGEAIGVDFVDVTETVQNPPAVIDSNIGGASYGAGSRTIKVNGGAGGSGTTIFSKGAKVLSTDLPAGSTVAGRLGWLAAATALGTKLGKTLSSAIYELGGGWEYNPENWRALVDADSPLDDLDKAALRILFGLDEETGSVTPYLNSDALGAMYLTMLQSGAFTPTEATYTGEADVSGVPQPLLLIPSNVISYSIDGGQTYRTVTFTNTDYICVINDGGVSRIIPFGHTGVISASDAGEAYSFTGVTAAGTTFYYNTYHTGGYTFPAGIASRVNYSANTSWIKYGTVIYDGTVAGDMPGVDDDTEGATYFPSPSTITGTDLDTVNQQLRQNYPQLYDGEIYEDVPQPDGTNKRITYIPVPFPNTSNPTQPITGDNHQNNPTSNPTTNTDEQLDDLIDLITDILTPFMQPNPNTPTETPPPSTGTGSTPAIVTPAGSASSLWSVYNPTQAQVNSFGGWLWSSSFVEQLKKLFNDPMQAIIGIHKVYATPATGETRTIVCGYIDSEVPSKIVTSQYTTIDCGTVNLREYYGNVFDYAPFTEVSLYLPFIGIVKLDVGDVMRASIKVKYHVDVITGACLADVIVTRDNAGGVIYQYSGSAIVTYPISSGSYASAIGGIMSIAGGIAATVMTGGAAAPAVLGAAAGMTHLHSDVQKSGSFTGAAGAMGSKKPYLIISRPQTGMPSKFAHLQGYPVNYYTKLGDCSGHVRVSEVQVKGVNATDTELDMIRDALLQGIEI